MNDLSLARFAAMAKSNPHTRRYVERTLVDSYESFIDILYKDLDDIVLKTQERKQVYGKSSEDEITMHIVDLLEEQGYWATHDPKIGGHVDISVRHPNDRSWLWLGEAKLDKGPAWVASGMEQLCRRYSDGGLNRGHGGILIYVQGKHAAKKLQNWRDELEKNSSLEDLVVFDCARSPGLAFNSKHLHDTSGLPYTIRHIAVALYHEPTV